MTDFKNKENLLVVTSTFPKSVDWGNHFILELCKAFTDKFNVIVSTPKVLGSKNYEEFNDIIVYRNTVILDNFAGLNEGIKIKLSKNPWLVFLVPLYIYSQILAINNLVKKYNVKKIQSNWLLPSTFSCILFKKIFKNDIKVLCTVHGSDINKYKSKLAILIKKFTLSGVDEVVCVSEDLKDEIIRMGYRKEIRVIPVGIDTGRFVPSKNLVNDCRLLFVGTIIIDKGIKELIQAIDLCRRKKPGIELKVIGEGPYLEEAKLLVENLSLDKNIKFLGRIKNQEIPKYYQDTRLFVLPSASEGFPLVVSEALSTGLYCLVSDLKVFKELENNYSFIKTIDSKNSEQFAGEILKIIDDVKLLEKSKLLARRYAVSSLDWSKIKVDYEKALSIL